MPSTKIQQTSYIAQDRCKFKQNACRSIRNTEKLSEAIKFNKIHTGVTFLNFLMKLDNGGSFIYFHLCRLSRNCLQ